MLPVTPVQFCVNPLTGPVILSLPSRILAVIRAGSSATNPRKMCRDIVSANRRMTPSTNGGLRVKRYSADSMIRTRARPKAMASSKIYSGVRLVLMLSPLA